MAVPGKVLKQQQQQPYMPPSLRGIKHYPHEAEVDNVITLLGLPNAGKSTLVNHLTSVMTTIAHRKARTTRTSIAGIIKQANRRIALVDTPGLLDPDRELEHVMMRATKHQARAADLLLLVVDAASVRAVNASLNEIKRWISSEIPSFLVLNKVDRTAKPSLLATASAFHSQHLFKATYMLSAHTGDGTHALLNGFKQHLPAPFPRKLPMIPLPFLAAELTRSVLLDYLHDELPRDLAVIPSTWRVLKDGSIRIEQTILVCRASQRAIVLGRKGNMIRLLREKTCKKINYYMNFPVHLFLHVKLQPSWPSDPPIRKQLGL